MYCPTNLLFFHIPLTYYYTNLNSSIICCISSGYIYLSFSISISLLASVCCNSLEDFLKTLDILSAILLPIKSPVPFAMFKIALF